MGESIQNSPEQQQQKQTDHITESREAAAKALGIDVAKQPTQLDGEVKANLAERFGGTNPGENYKELVAKWKEGAKYNNQSLLDFLKAHSNPDLTPNNIALAESRGETISVTGDVITPAETSSLEVTSSASLALEALGSYGVDMVGKVAEITPLEMESAIESAQYEVYANTENGAPAVIEQIITTRRGTIYRRHILRAGDESTASVQVIFDPSNKETTK